MPARFYLDDDIFDREKAAIFYRSWLYAGHASQLSKPGDYITTMIFEQNIFVVRDNSSALRAYYNVCQHRGHELLAGAGNTNMIICPYHAWTYDFDGTLKAARNIKGMARFDKCDFSLKPVRVEDFCGLIFINLDQDAEPLKDQTRDLEHEIREYCPTVDSLVFSQRDHYEVSCNWKVLIDNYLECYHCDTAHRDFVDLVDLKSYRSKLHGNYSSHISNAAKSTDSAAYKFETGDVDFGFAGWYLWPNLTIMTYPGEPNLSTLQMIPAGPGRTIEHQDWFLPAKKPSKQLKESMQYSKNVLQPEDIGLCESVQRGLRSHGYNQGRFVIDSERSELSEHAVHHFQGMVIKALGAELAE